ncbi:MAG: hypothetical protein WDO13_21445 [Verrucomicrobiota bacterium]
MSLLPGCVSAVANGRIALQVSAFTLVEMMVSIVILVAILLLFSQMIGQTSSIWASGNSKMSQFREGRTAFDALVSRLRQATVDSYDGYQFTSVTTGTTTSYTPSTYYRRSELRFLCGPSGGSSGVTQLTLLADRSRLLPGAAGAGGRHDRLRQAARPAQHLRLLRAVEQRGCRPTAHPDRHRHLPLPADAVHPALGVHVGLFPDHSQSRRRRQLPGLHAGDDQTPPGRSRRCRASRPGRCGRGRWPTTSWRCCCCRRSPPPTPAARSASRTIPRRPTPAT